MVGALGSVVVVWMVGALEVFAVILDALLCVAEGVVGVGDLHEAV